MVRYLWKTVVIAVLLALLLVLAPAPYAIFDAYADIIELPVDIKEGGMPFKWENFTSDTHYEDPSITVDIVWGGRIHDTNYVYALIKIANATQLRSALSNDNFKDWKTYGHKIAKSKNAVFAVNGDFCKAKDYTHGYIVREGHLYRNRPSRTWDALLIDQYGNFHPIMEPTQEKIETWLAENPDLQVINSFNFGPVLIQDGEFTRNTFNNVKDKNLDINLNTDYIGTYKLCQRTCICQLDTLTYLCITSEGPEDKDCKGMTMDEFADCIREIDEQLTDYTIQTAYNLDGGSSSTFVFKAPGKNELYKINAPTNPKVRELYDIIYFASAWQE